MKNIIDRPFFLTSDSLKIICLKDGDSLEDTENVKPEFLLELHDRVVYLGNKRYVIPVYEVTASPEPEVGDIYYDSLEGKYCEVIEVNRDKEFGVIVKAKFEKGFTLDRFMRQFDFIKKSRAYEKNS